jgi:hypothetical protein
MAMPCVGGIVDDGGDDEVHALVPMEMQFGEAISATLLQYYYELQLNQLHG